MSIPGVFRNKDCPNPLNGSSKEVLQVPNKKFIQVTQVKGSHSSLSSRTLWIFLTVPVSYCSHWDTGHSFFSPWAYFFYNELLSPMAIFALYARVLNSFEIPWTVALSAPLAMGFTKQEYWSVLPFPIPGDLPGSGTKPTSLTSPALAGRFFTTFPALPGKHCLLCKNLFGPEPWASTCQDKILPFRWKRLYFYRSSMSQPAGYYRSEHLSPTLVNPWVGFQKDSSLWFPSILNYWPPRPHSQRNDKLTDCQSGRKSGHTWLRTLISILWTHLSAGCIYLFGAMSNGVCPWRWDL